MELFHVGDAPLSENRGEQGEEVALLYLQKKGYDIVARNYTIYGGELDIIAFKDGLHIFVEVRYRKNTLHAHPLDTLTFQKRQRLKKTIFSYMNTHAISLDMIRVDMIGLLPTTTKQTYMIWHIEGIEL